MACWSILTSRFSLKLSNSSQLLNHFPSCKPSHSKRSIELWKICIHTCIFHKYLTLTLFVMSAKLANDLWLQYILNEPFNHLTNQVWSRSSNYFFYKTLISTVDCYGEKTTKHFDQCGSHDDKNALYVGDLGQITDTITRFWSTNYIFFVWVTSRLRM